MTDQQICDAIGKQAALAAVFAMWARQFANIANSERLISLPDYFQIAFTARANHFHDMSLRFIDHTLRLIATHQTAVETMLASKDVAQS